MKRISVKDLPVQDNSARMVEILAKEHSKLMESDNPSIIRASSTLSITAGKKERPAFILYDEARSKLAKYDMTFLKGCATPMVVSLRIKADPDALESGFDGFDEEIPLRMLPYKTPTDPSLCFDAKACKTIDKLNESIERHNQFIVSILSLFVAQNGCGTSANHVTLPSPAPDLAETREIRINELKNDKHGYLMLAIQYLANKHQKYAVKDYEVDQAVILAEKLAMEDEIVRKIDKGKGKVFVKIAGSPRSTWSGRSDDLDSMGRTLKWEAAKTHSFVFPDVRAVKNEMQMIIPECSFK